MDSLKRFYFSLTSGLAFLTGHKAEIEIAGETNVVTRVSRNVDHYRTHFFNV